ncbi:hypothetical protein [Amycolatopsis mediterranei]|uniref:hypothetical protein n=1 Tax=Amycolatopsis mediterranei TaxID=33910 RepID=UPI00114D391F|nr:hypothetical protein [Amycolatopsis mediterranei]UZF72546.1 hypothetical protein ISP_005914 [Amycolatopsis mediterranei]
MKRVARTTRTELEVIRDAGGRIRELHPLNRGHFGQHDTGGKIVLATEPTIARTSPSLGFTSPHLPAASRIDKATGSLPRCEDGTP